jgi:uncharacterized protein
MQTPEPLSHAAQAAAAPPATHDRRGALIVSLHDVSPLTRPQCDAILTDLEEAGLRALSLLVIPDHHGRAPVMGDEAFRAWLGAGARGREVVLHGYHHLREVPPGGDRPLARLVTAHYTAGEGEFYDPDTGRARALLARGLESLAWCGFAPRGFIAPAWLLGKEALMAVRGAGFDYTTRLDRIEPLGPGRVVTRARSLVWSTRARWRRGASLAWNAFLFAALRKAPVLRIGIHPPDWNSPPVRRQILSIVGRALARRRAFTYEGWVSQDRP